MVAELLVAVLVHPPEHAADAEDAAGASGEAEEPQPLFGVRCVPGGLELAEALRGHLALLARHRALRTRHCCWNSSSQLLLLVNSNSILFVDDILGKVLFEAKNTKKSGTVVFSEQFLYGSLPVVLFMELMNYFICLTELLNVLHNDR